MLTLIKFTCVGGATVYINPVQVVSVEGDNYSTLVRTSSGKDYYIADTMDKVVDNLVEHLPKTHY